MNAELLVRSQQLLAAGQTANALKLLEGERERGGPGLYSLLGYGYYQDNRIADAKRALETGLARFPFDPTLHEAMARMRWLSGDGDHFIDGFLAALAERPADLGLRIKCADLLRLAGMAPAAERLLRDALAGDPDEMTVQAWLAVLLDETGQFEESLATHRNVVHAWPDDAILRLNLAHTLSRMHRADEALREIIPIRRNHPDLQLAITYEADALRQLGDPRAK